MVVLVDIPDLRWDDVSTEGTPALWGLVLRGSAGVLAVRGLWPRTGCADGLLTLGAADRAAAEPRDATPLGCDGATGPPSAYQHLATSARSTATLGALGLAIADADVAVSADGPGARLMVDPPSGAHAASGGRDLVLSVVVLTSAESPRAQAVRTLDAALARRLRDVPRDASVLVVGGSDAAAGPVHLHVAIAAGPTFPVGWLSSASTSRTPYSELIDVAPTIVTLLGLPVPPAWSGRPWQGRPSTAPGPERLSRLRDLDRQSVQGSRWRTPFAWLLVTAVLMTCAAAILRLAGITRVRTPRRWDLLPLVLRTVAALPLGTWLAQAVPWWRASVWVLVAVVLAVALATAALATHVARRHPVAGILLVTIPSGGLLLWDIVSGSRLQVAALLGDLPTTAARFHGSGNASSAVVAAATVLVVGLLAASLPQVLRITTIIAAGTGVTAVLGSPTLGADLGGVLALAPAVVVLAVSTRRRRPRRAVAAAAAGSLVAMLIVGSTALLWDATRTSGGRTHLGRFGRQAGGASGGTVLARKADAAAATLVTSPFALLLVGAAVATVVLWLLRDVVTRQLPNLPGLWPSVASLAVAGVVGSMVNDSGVLVLGMTLTLGTPVVLAACLDAARAEETLR